LTLGFKSRAARIAGAILLSVCLLLSAARLFMLLWRLRQIRMLKLQSLPASEALNELFRGLVSRLGAGRKVELKTLPTAKSSFVLGFLHPVILLPAEPMEPAEAEPILRHELAHVRRRDDWANLLQHFILAAFPFHPAVWWISRRLSLEREIACDDYVLQSSAHPHAYALLLANLAARMQRCPPLLAPGASNNKTQLQQRIDMILNTRRNTSPRLAAKWLTFMASTAALFAVTALCLAPRIVLAQSAAAPAAENTQDSLIDEPVQATPAVASVAASFSPEAGAAASSDAAPPATPKPPAIGSGPKLKTGGSWAVPGQPAVEPVPPTLSVLTAPAVPAAPAPLTAQSAPLMSQGSFVLSAAPVPEPRPGRTPRLARAESADSTLEERLERLEKMVESLMSRKDAPQNPYLLKPSPEKVGPIDRKEMAELAAEMARRHELEDQIIKEHARREAARAADLTKRAAGDAEKIARAEQKRQTRLKELQLKGITGTPGRRIAVINNLTFTQGEEGEVRARNGRIKIRVLEIRDKSVLLQIEGLAEPKELLLQEGSQKQLDELRKRLEMLDREREKLEREIEQLERNQEQLEEQPEEELDNDVQSDTSEVNSDSIQTPRQ